MILHRASIAADWRDRLRRALPRATDAQLDAFIALVASDRLLDDAMQPTPEFLAWCEALE